MIIHVLPAIFLSLFIFIVIFMAVFYDADNFPLLPFFRRQSTDAKCFHCSTTPAQIPYFDTSRAACDSNLHPYISTQRTQLHVEDCLEIEIAGQD